MPADLPPTLFIPTPSMQTIKNNQPQSLIIPCGSGQVSISLKDGKVTMTDCAADDGALAFWRAVERLAPMNKP